MTMMFMLRERKKKKELPSGEAAQNNVFLCSKIRDSLSLGRGDQAGEKDFPML